MEAEKFGIETCIFTDRSIPKKFTSGETILITTAHKFFNGMSIFGLDARHAKINSIILDDSHATMDVINSAFTVTLKSDDSPYIELLNLFTPDLKHQGEGTFIDLCSKDYDTLMQIPYWSWEEKSSDVLSILSKYKDSVDSIKYSWNLLKDIIPKCKAFISGDSLEISPYYLPIEKFPAFNNAKNKILMSATTQNDVFLIQGLGFRKETVQNPLVDVTIGWTGEKMLIIPESIKDDPVFSEYVRSRFSKLEYPFGALAIVPSNKKSKIYTTNGATLIDKSQITNTVNLLKSNNFTNNKLGLFVMSNKYDGIDLADAACRILILDSLPYFESLCERYEERVRPSSDIIQKKLAQKIEQGLGRSVRGEKDYSAIIVLGYDLVSFLTAPETKNLFSEDTQKQIDIGEEIVSLSRREHFNSDQEILNDIISVIKQSLERDEGWKDFYRNRMNTPLDAPSKPDDILEILELEYQSEKAFYCGDYSDAITIAQRLADRVTNKLEKGWYLQNKARFENRQFKTEAIATQKTAQKNNIDLLIPNETIDYERLEIIDGNRNQRIIEFLRKYGSHDGLLREVQVQLNNLSFGQQADKFERALDYIGHLLGYVTDRPDKTIRKGPDNLWGVRRNEFFMFECKSEVKETRDAIDKKEVGQFNNHCGWFENVYGVDTKVTRFVLIPTKKIAHDANFTHNVRVIRKGKLKILKDNIINFIKELAHYNLSEMNIETVQNLLSTHSLNTDNFENIYSEEFRKLQK
ncbi:helicase C-terminal domain-containing protein [Streptococcus merionis]